MRNAYIDELYLAQPKVVTYPNNTFSVKIKAQINTLSMWHSLKGSDLIKTQRSLASNYRF